MAGGDTAAFGSGLDDAGPRLSPGDASRLQRNGGSLVLRVPSHPDPQRMAMLLDTMLVSVSEASPLAVVLDFSETLLLDSTVVQRIENAARQARILGVPTVLCELRPALCGALVELAQGFPSIVKAGSIDQALETARRGVTLDPA